MDNTLKLVKILHKIQDKAENISGFTRESFTSEQMWAILVLCDDALDILTKEEEKC